MRRGIVRAAFAALALGCTPTSEPAQLFVAASVSDLAWDWQSALGKDRAFQFHTGGSMMLANQLLAGARADLLLAAGPLVLDRLYQHDLVDRVDSAYLRNRLVLVCAVNVPAPAALQGIIEPRFERIAIADPDLAPAGHYAREGLQRAGLWSVLENRLIITGDVRSALAAVASGSADAGFVYETDAHTEPTLPVLRLDSASLFPSADYPLVLINPARTKALALWDWLHSDTARAQARGLGFR